MSSIKFHSSIARGGLSGTGKLNKELDFRSWHCGRQGDEIENKELEFRSSHCGRQAGGSFKLDFGPWHIVEGKRAKCK